jgi:hypothetical protein
MHAATRASLSSVVRWSMKSSGKRSDSASATSTSRLRAFAPVRGQGRRPSPRRVPRWETAIPRGSGGPGLSVDRSRLS